MPAGAAGMQESGFCECKDSCGFDAKSENELRQGIVIPVGEMNSKSPTIEGFRAAFKRPAIACVEVAWRWSVGLVASALIAFGAIEYLDSLGVSRGDELLLGSRQPFLIGRAIVHIFRGTISRAAAAAMVGALGITVLWIVAGALGRSTTVRALLRYFRSVDAASGTIAADTGEISTGIGPLAVLNFLRVVASLAALLALVGTIVIGSLVSPQRGGGAAVIFIALALLAGLIGVIWAELNWTLSFAAIFTVRNGAGAMGALRESIAFMSDRKGSIFAVSAWNGILHLVAFVSASTASSVLVALVQIAPGRIIVAGMWVVTLAYFAIVDWLYIARLAGYIFAAEMPEITVASVSMKQRDRPSAPEQGAVDQSELILSDLPGLAFEP